MMIEMPIEAVPAQSFTVQLTENKYKLDIQWNDRGQYFTMSISEDVTGAVVAYGLPLVLGQDVLFPYNFGIGSFIMVDTSNRGQEATVENFGTRLKLCWFSEDEKDAILQ